MDLNEAQMRGLLPKDPTANAIAMNSRARRLTPVDDDPPFSNVAPVEGAPRIALPKLTAAEIFAPLPPLQYNVAGLDICSGAPVLVAGYGFAGKTLAIQQLALDITQGSPAWGIFPTRQGRVLHIDYEQGHRLTRERYQRLCVGATLGPQDLDDRLVLSCHPPLFLDSPVAEEVLREELSGFQLCIVDSFRAAAPSLEENSSDVRRVLDMLNRVSDFNGCAVIVIHHARKPSREAAGGARASIRGSGAIYDACSSVLVFSAEKGQPTTVSHEKARNSGVLAKDFQLAIDDVELGGKRRAGLMVAGRSCSESSDPRDHRGALDELKTRVREYLREHGDYEGGANALRQTLGVNRDKLYAALSEMKGAGELKILGTHKSPIIHLETKQ